MAYPSTGGVVNRRPPSTPTGTATGAGAPMTPDEYDRWYAQQQAGTRVGSAGGVLAKEQARTKPAAPSTGPSAVTGDETGDTGTMADLTKYGYSKAPVGSAPTDRGSGRGFGGYTYSGFDFDQSDQNRRLGKSPKYTLAEATRLAGEAGAGDDWKTKAGAEAYAQQWILPLFEANGIQVLDIKGEKMQLHDQYGTYWVDWVINADGPNASIGWQPESSAAAFGGPLTRYAPQPFVPMSDLAVDPTSMTPEEYRAWYARQNTNNPDDVPEIDPGAYDRARLREVV